MIDRSWFNAIPHLHKQYSKEMFVLAIAWGTFGVLCTISSAILFTLILGE